MKSESAIPADQFKNAEGELEIAIGDQVDVALDAVEDGFQWGLGASYAFTEEVSVFADYISLYDDTGFDYRAKLDDVDADTWTVGLTYNF